MALITGSPGPDSLPGTNNADIISALGGDDTINSRLGLDVVDGSTGTDLLIVDYSSVSGNIESDFSGGDGTITVVDTTITNQVSYSGIEILRLTGTQQADTLTATTGNDTLNGNGGNDLIFAGGYLDFSNPTAYTGLAQDIITGGSGSDTLNAADFSAEAGNLWVDESGSSIGTNGHMIVSEVEHFSKLATGSGNDQISFSSVFNNNIFTGAGDDTINTGLGNDIVDGGANDDLLRVDYSALSDAITSTSAGTLGTIGAGAQSVEYSGIERLHVIGTTLADQITTGTGNDTLEGGSGADTLAGGDGNDTYEVGAGDQLVENANEGDDLVRSGATFTLAANLEDLILIGSGDIDGTGNSDANEITGNSGNNRLDGGAGADTLTGGDGNDTYVVGAGDQIVENSNEGTDTVEADVTFTLAANFENLTLTGTGDIDGTGNSENNAIVGNSGNNRLDGLAGTDTLTGGDGNDTYVVGSGDQVVENANEGDDLVESSVTFTLTANLEDLTLTGTDNINGTGNGEANQITGNSGNNRLDGGAGADTLTGGDGDDTYVVGTGDQIVENADEGDDLVESDATFTLVANLEDLTLTGTDNIDGTGNDEANEITGNSGNNRLDGGDGADTLAGGDGDDTYVVGTGDQIIENADEGDDTVEADASFTLSANLENLTLTGSANIDGTGNTDANEITGNSGNNRLDGGAGADSLAGGDGDDTYVVGTGDQIVENADEGIDTVESSATFTLSADLENLSLQGGADIDGTGNDEDNQITGNFGNNQLSGAAGADTLTGGDGNDTYVVDAGDTIVENANQGVDSVISQDSFVLGANLENLTLTGLANSSGTGNGQSNVLTGNVGSNQLDGGGGADQLIGGAGNDNYIVDNRSDSIVESSSEGTDTVFSSVDFSLSSNVENLRLTGSAINGTGNGFDNEILGNNSSNKLLGFDGNDQFFGEGGNDSLNGGNGSDTLAGGSGRDTLDGGTGRDFLFGGAGNDLYIVHDKQEVVSDTSGIDTMRSSASRSLSSGLENLELTGQKNLNASGNSRSNLLTGNRGDNGLNGNAGNDTLVGGSAEAGWTGKGSVDKLTGGGGKDRFVLGDSKRAFYNDGRADDLGFSDYADISDFSRGDKLVLHGDAGDYVLGTTSNNRQLLLLDSGSTKGEVDQGDEIIAQVNSKNALDLNRDAAFLG